MDKFSLLFCLLTIVQLASTKYQILYQIISPCNSAPAAKNSKYFECQLHDISQHNDQLSVHTFQSHTEGNLVERGDDGEDGHVQQTGSHRVSRASRSVEGNHLQTM